MSRLLRSNLVFIVIIALFAVYFRFLPHPANFAPIGAVALLGGILLPKRFATFAILAVMIVSDLFIGLHPLIIWTWGSFALIAILSSTFLNSRKISASRLVLSATAGGTLFFIVTNFGVWLQGGLYEKSLQGLTDCFINALPFYRNTILGDVFFAATFYLVYMFIQVAVTKRATQQKNTPVLVRV